jgi:hypothetical protein
MKLTYKTTVEVEVDLATLPFEEWPEEAKTLLQTVLNRHYKRVQEMLPETRKSWLVAKVEALAALYKDMEIF